MCKTYVHIFAAQNTPILFHRQILVVCSITLPCAAGSVPVLALEPGNVGSRKPGGLPISHLCTAYNCVPHTDAVLPGQE